MGGRFAVPATAASHAEALGEMHEQLALGHSAGLSHATFPLPWCPGSAGGPGRKTGARSPAVPPPSRNAGFPRREPTQRAPIAARRRQPIAARRRQPIAARIHHHTDQQLPLLPAPCKVRCTFARRRGISGGRKRPPSNSLANPATGQSRNPAARHLAPGPPPPGPRRDGRAQRHRRRQRDRRACHSGQSAFASRQITMRSISSSVDRLGDYLGLVAVATPPAASCLLCDGERVEHRGSLPRGGRGRRSPHRCRTYGIPEAVAELSASSAALCGWYSSSSFFRPSLSWHDLQPITTPSGAHLPGLAKPPSPVIGQGPHQESLDWVQPALFAAASTAGQLSVPCTRRNSSPISGQFRACGAERRRR